MATPAQLGYSVAEATRAAWNDYQTTLRKAWQPANVVGRYLALLQHAADVQGGSATFELVALAVWTSATPEAAIASVEAM